MLQEVKCILFVLHVTLATLYLDPTEVYDVTTIYHIGSIYNNTAKEKRVEVHSRTNAKGLPIDYGGLELDDSVIGRHYPTLEFGLLHSNEKQNKHWTTEGWNLKFEELLFSSDDYEKTRFTLSGSIFEVQKLPRIMKIEFKGYSFTSSYSYYNRYQDYVDDSEIYMALLPNKTLLRHLSGFYRIRFSCNNNKKYLEYCHSATTYDSLSIKDFDGVTFKVKCDNIVNLGKFQRCPLRTYGFETVQLDFSNESLQLKDQNHNYKVWEPSLSDPPMDAKYFTIYYTQADSYKLYTNFLVAEALISTLDPNVTHNFPLISPWFTADTDELCVAIVVNGTGQAEINITAENKEEERYPLQNFIEFYQPGTVIRLISSVPEYLKTNEIRLILTVHDYSSPITIQRISGCNGKEKSDVAVLTMKEVIPDIAYNVESINDQLDKAWCYNYLQGKPSSSITTTYNGGCNLNSASACPPGFSGLNCEQACGPNRFGSDCKGVCSVYNQECQGLLLCTPAMRCKCAPGYAGHNCEEECEPGKYGNNCEQYCGHCEDQKACDIYTGHCATCDYGYFPPYCKDTYPVVEEPPEVLDTGYGQAEIKPILDTYKGRGTPTGYQIQYRESEAGIANWIQTSFYFSFDANTSTTMITGLVHGKIYDVRVILFDDNLNSYEGKDVPVTSFRSLCDIPEQVEYNITSKSNTTSTSITWNYKNTTVYWCPVIHYEVTREEDWQEVSENTTDTSFALSNLLSGREIKFKVRAYTSGGFAPYSSVVTLKTKIEVPGPVQSLSSEHEDNYEIISWLPPINLESGEIEYHVKLQCLRRRACTAKCSPSDSFELHVTNTSTTLYSLLPFTQYKVTVSADEGPSSSIVIGTKMSAPTESVKPSSLPPIRTNNSIVVFWEPVEVCSGFLKGYIYQLHKVDDSKIIATGYTKETFFKIMGLTAKTDYLAKIFIETVYGRDMDKYMTLNITTSATVPEPVKNLTVYKKGRNLLGLRWEKPSKLYGTLKSFTISYGYGNQSKVVTISPTPCIVWPHLYCHTLENLSPMKKYKVTVAARNTEVSEDGISTSVTEITREGIAGVPENVTVVNTTSISFAVSWKYPSMANGIIRSFLMSIEEVEQYETEQCCQIFPLVETIVEEELPKYTAEISGLHPASTYTVSLSAKTVSFGLSVTLTIYTRPPPMPLQYLPNVTVKAQEKWSWMPQNLLENVNNIQTYQSLIKSNILLVVQNSTTDNFLSGIEHKQLEAELKKNIKTDFYFVAEYFKDDVVLIGNDESRQTQWGTLSNPGLTLGQTYRLAAVQVSEYCGVFNIDIVYSSTFTAL